MSITFTCPEHGDKAIYADGEAVCVTRDEVLDLEEIDMSRLRTAVIPGTINGQTHTQAKKLYEQAEASEVQAQIFMDMAQVIREMDSVYADDQVFIEMRNGQVASLEQLATEMYDDADDRRGRIETEWIDYL